MDLEKEKEIFNRRKVVNMKLEHFIQAYNFNNIPAKIKEEIQQDNEKAGTIEFCKGIAASYLLDSEEIVVAMKLFINCLTRDELTILNQISHISKVLNIIQQTIMLLGNIPQKECNMILEKLGLFDNTFRSGKQIKHLEHIYKIEVINGLLCLSVEEET